MTTSGAPVPQPVPEPAEQDVTGQEVTGQGEADQVRARQLRLAVLGTLAAHGLTLTDPQAAADCGCSCHPRVTVEGDLHHGGAACPCQLTPVQRAEQSRAAFALLTELNQPDPDELERAEQARAAFVREAVALAVDARIAVQGAPFVISGRVDGCAFYLRSRHGSYRVHVNPTLPTGRDAWDEPLSEDEVLVGSGEDSQLFGDHLPGGRLFGDDSAGSGAPGAGDVAALRVAVGLVRTWLRRQGCEHHGAPAGARYCPACGQERTPAYLP